MLITDAFETFDILQDKFGAPYFPDDWKVRLFNRAQYTYINKLVPDNQGGRVNVELDSNTASNVKPLIFNLQLNTTSGLLSNSDILSALVSESHAGATILRLLSIRSTDGTKYFPVRYAKYNNIWTYFDNSFKKPLAPHKMRWTFQADGYQFYPTSDTTDLLLTVLKAPREVALTPSQVDPEFSDYAVQDIITYMLDEAGVATRDAQLIETVRATTKSQ